MTFGTPRIGIMCFDKDGEKSFTEYKYAENMKIEKEFEWTDGLVGDYLAQFLTETFKSLEAIQAGKEPPHIVSMAEFKSTHTPVEGSVDWQVLDKCLIEVNMWMHEPTIILVEGTISEVYHDKKEVIVLFVNPNTNKTNSVRLPFSKLKQVAPAVPVKEVLFVTEDGKNVYDGDLAFYVEEENNFMVVSHSGISKKRPHKYFSTKELANEYVLTHSPVLSYEDIIKLSDPSVDYKPFDLRYFSEEKLKQLIQQRLNK